MLGYAHHISITCGNINNTKALYHLLGFSEIKHYRDDDCMILHLADRTGFIIELFCFTKNHDDKRKNAFSIETKGITHFAITVCNIHEALMLLKNKGIQCGEITTARIDSYRYFFTYDPEGNAVEIIEEIE
ncbi:VOC family protein [Yersinia mollaretii]|uniref:VOC family protein n=1 Tax=Yersinia mollaretii TaxID=33060 RepID=UPI0011A1705C|nr:VOC family protein [Yersinia mollaretii]